MLANTLIYDFRGVGTGIVKDKGECAMTETVERMAVAMKAQRHLRIVSGETTPGPTPARMANPEKRVPRTEEKAQVREICAGIRARLDAVPFKASLSPATDTPDKGPVGAQALRDAKARKDADFAYTLEKGRRMGMALDAGGATGWGKYFVPMDQPLADDLRAKYGHRCPGYDPPATSARDRHEAKIDPPKPEMASPPCGARV